jgi:hypothetical protein
MTAISIRASIVQELLPFIPIQNSSLSSLIADYCGNDPLVRQPLSPEETARVQSLLGQEHLNPAELLLALGQNPSLKYLFDLDAGVSEGYTVKQHTKMVLDVAQEFRAQFYDSVVRVVPWNTFVLFLCLHDIGKGISKSNETAFDSPISLKEAELKMTQEVMADTMKLLAIPEAHIAVFVQLLSYDSQGLYLRDLISCDEAYDNMVEMANACGVELGAYYQLFEIFHKIDAASYPVLRSSIFKLANSKLMYIETNQKLVDDLQLKIQQAITGKAVFETLLKKINDPQAQVKEVRKEVVANVANLQSFLEKVHKEMLVASEGGLKQRKSEFRNIKRGFRDLFLFLARDSKDLKILIESYQNLIKTPLQSATLRQFTRLLFLGINDIENLVIFIDQVISFRKDYLCRYSVEKIMLKTGQDFWKVLFQFDSPQKLHQVLKVTFLHGSNTAIFPNLLLTGMQLIPSGRLFQMGIVPLSGELSEGSTVKGVNRYNLSGVPIEQMSTAVFYATRTDFHTIESQEEKMLKAFLEDIEKAKRPLFQNVYHVMMGRFSQRVIAAIRRLKALNPKLYGEFENLLKRALRDIENDFEQYKASPDYAAHYQKEKGLPARCYYFNQQFEVFEGFIKSFKEALSKPVLIPKGIVEAIKTPSPVVFGSTTLHTSWKSDTERVAQKAATLGKDIQIMFVDPQNKMQLEACLKDNGLQGRVNLFTTGFLCLVHRMYDAAQLYLQDFASIKKLKKLAKPVIPSESAAASSSGSTC